MTLPAPRTTSPAHGLAVALAVLAGVSGGLPGWGAEPGAAQSPVPRLIHGEELHYTGDFGVFGKVGSGVLSVGAPACFRGRTAVRLDFTFQGRVMLMRIRDETSSWVDPATLASLRYHKEENHPMGERTERVEIHPEEGWWEPEGGVVHALESEHPLDELSFLFLARSLELEEGEMREFPRHFDPARNPVRMRDRGRERIRVPAGEFDVRVVEMEVHDPSRFGDAGRVVLYLTDDAARIPVRISTAMPVVGALVLVLDDRSVAAAPSPNPPTTC